MAEIKRNIKMSDDISKAPLELKVKVIGKGIMPEYGNAKAACFDIAIPVRLYILPNSIVTMALGICFSIPAGYHLEVYPRSSTITKHGLIIPTSIIDEDYRDEIHLQVFNAKTCTQTFERGTRLLQAKLVKSIPVYLSAVNSIPPTGRGGLGSTGE